MYQLAILRNENRDNHLPWVSACEKKADTLTYDVIDLTRGDWQREINKKNYDCFLMRPPGLTGHFKQLYDERAFILAYFIRKRIYPSLQEILLYENKRFFSDWLKANRLPHPRTHVFYYKEEAYRYLKGETFPVVAKINIGASGAGVRILQNKDEAASYINRAFSTGISRKTGPKITKGSMLKKIKKVVLIKGFVRQRLKEYKAAAGDVQRNFVIFQEYIPHTFEWRCVRIGDSFFAHKKIATQGKASGTLIKGYENPPLVLLDFMKNLTEKHQLYSAAVDLFEKDAGIYLVNEIQAFFGQSDPYQMLVNGRPGRYLLQDGKWVFEEGDFNTNKSYDLRLQHVIDILKTARRNTRAD